MGDSHTPLSNKMNLLQVVQTSYEPNTYVMNGSLCSGGCSLALSLSNQTVRLYDTQTTSFLADLKDHTEAITDLVATQATPSLLYSSQSNGGVMVTDLRQARPAHFFTDLCGLGATCSSISIAPSGGLLAVAADRDIHTVDPRTWTAVHCVEQLHMDEISRLRFMDERLLCSAGEDQMMNVVDVAPEVVDDDVLVQGLNCGEVMSRMSCFPELGLTAMIGTCENGYVCSFNTDEPEQKFSRPDYNTYLVDWALVSGELFLILGRRDDDGNAAGMQVWQRSTGQTQMLPHVHKEIGRVAIGFGDRLITGGEDGMLVYWKHGALTASEAATSTASSSRKIGGGKNLVRGGGGGGGSGPSDRYAHNRGAPYHGGGGQKKSRGRPY